jgi:hypothetical protein
MLTAHTSEHHGIAKQTNTRRIINKKGTITRIVGLPKTVLRLIRRGDMEPTRLLQLGAELVVGFSRSIWRSWYFPLGCNAPIGLTWKLDGLSFKDITEAVTAICSKSAEQFVSLLERSRDDFINWLAVVTAAPAFVAVSVIPWSTFSPVLPSITIGDLPESLDEPELIMALCRMQSFSTCGNTL